MNMLKRSLAMFLVVCLMFSAVPLVTFAAETDDTTPTATESTDKTMTAAEEAAEATKETAEPTEDPYGIDLADLEIAETSLTYADQYRILHLDCGRKYFTKDWIIALLNEMAAAGYTHLELAFGNDGLRFLLDDMSVGTYRDSQVTAAIQQGNKNYYDFGTNELTESEMDAIIDHANNVGIEIIPLLNNPGHMNTIVSAASSLTGSSAGYNGSSSTVDLENSDAVSFTKGLVQKYVAYFDSKGCNEFNFGADEYANDVYPYGSMGFGALVYAEKYPLYVSYVNDIAALVKSYGMVPMAFNDGIYFNQNTSYNFDTQIMVAFWTSGWTGYQSASASVMASKGHEMINVNGDYYYVLGKSDQWDSNGYTYASNWSNTAFMGSTVSDPAGSMFCIWCDYPNAETETQIAANTRMILRAMAAEMQGKDAYTISTEVVPGGFNEDGSLNGDPVVEPEPQPNPVTKTDDATGIAVTAPGLTGLTVTQTTAPAIEGAEAVLAWTMTPVTADGSYTGSATVSVPVPSTWTNVRGGVLDSESGEEKLGIEGELKDGIFTFTVPHFSTAIVYNVGDPASTTVDLDVGSTAVRVIEGGDYTNNIKIEDNTVVKVTASYTYQEGSGGSVETVTSLEAGKEYYITNSAGKYLAADLSWVDSSAQAVTWTAKLEMSMGVDYYSLSYNGQYIDDPNDNGNWVLTSAGYTDLWFGFSGGVLTSTSGGSYAASTGAGGSEAISQTEVTFEGLKSGTTTVSVGDAIFTVTVHDTVEITIRYQTADGTVIKTETKTVRDDATSVTVYNFNEDDKYYVVENTTLEITPASETEYTVTVTESEENLNEVNPLLIELWITNSPASTEANGNVTEITVRADAEGIHSEAGVDVGQLVPETAYRAADVLNYWRSRLLQGEENHQIQQNGVDKTRSGLGFTKIRYWNSDEGSSWQVLSGDTWQKVDLTEDQLVAYYMQVTEVTDEVTTRVVDWGPLYGSRGNMSDWFWGGYVMLGNYVFLDYAVVYEGGTMSPNEFPNDNTAFFTADGGSRSINGMLFTEDSEYEIWKVTVTDGTSTRNSNGVDINYPLDDTDAEVTLWETDDGGVPYITGFESINAGEGKLIRIYVRAVETEDSLKVVYYDEKFNTSLREFFISVPNGSDFNNNIVVADTKDAATLPPFETNPERKNATGYGIVNALDKTQNFETSLADVAITNNRYNKDLYKYTGSVVSADGKTITHYYTIDQTALSPNFVADFGLPFKFPLSKVVTNGIDTVKSVTVNPTTLYGTLSYDPEAEEFTYTPTRILPTIDVLTINIGFAGADDTVDIVTTNVGVTPATTVYYGEQFLSFSDGWSTAGTYADVGFQEAEVLGNSGIYGYDDAYQTCTGASDGTASMSKSIGDSATFTFTGTGIQVFANSAPNSGYVSVIVKNKETGAIAKVVMVDTVASGTTDSVVTGGQIGKTLVGLPVVSLVDLTGLPHATYDVTISKVLDTDPVYIDGIRVFGTVDESKYDANGTTGSNPNPFLADEEDNPDFYEVRDIVLKAITISAEESKDYKTLYDQIYASTIEVGSTAVITSAAGAYGTFANPFILVADETAYTYTIDKYYKDPIDGKTYRCINAGEDSDSITLNKLPRELTDDYFVEEDAFNRQDLLDNGPKNELYLFNGDTLTINVSTDRVVQLGLKAPEGNATFELMGNKTTLSTTVDMFYKVKEKEKGDSTHTITVKNTGNTILSVTLLKVCDDPNFAFVPLTEANIKAILADAGITEAPAEPEKPTYTMVELKGTDVLIDGTVFDYTGSPIEPAITVKVNGTELVAGRDYSVTYMNNVEPGTATVIVRGIATASETLGYTGEIKIDYTINAPVTPEEPETPEEPTKPGNNKPGNNKPGENKPGNSKPGETKPGNSKPDNNKPGENKPAKPAENKKNNVKDATLKITFVNLSGKKVDKATITKSGAVGQECVFTVSEIADQAPAGRNVMWFLSVVSSYGDSESIIVPVL